MSLRFTRNSINSHEHQFSDLLKLYFVLPEAVQCQESSAMTIVYISLVSDSLVTESYHVLGDSYFIRN